MLLQPTCLSYLCLALTLYILWKPAEGTAPTARLFLIPPLFALWVNLDAWFLLGPLTVCLFLLGEILQNVVGRSEAAQGNAEHWELVLGWLDAYLKADSASAVAKS